MVKKLIGLGNLFLHKKKTTDAFILLIIAAIVVLGTINYLYAVYAGIFVGWSSLCYYKGKYSQAVDEYEQDEYSEEGWRWMIVGWVVAMFLAVMITAIKECGNR